MDRTCILVLGMHRSGTSPITRVLSLLGADLPANLLDPSPTENETGFWESADIVAVHDRFLSAIGSSWYDLRPIDEDAVNSEAGQRCRGELAALISRDFSTSRLFVIKDPRMARLAPIWCQLLDEMNIRRIAVIPVRHPLAVADSLMRRNGFARNTALALWLRHVLDAEAASRGMPRAVLSYDSMLADPETALRFLCDQLGCFDPEALDRALPQVRAFLSNRYRHHLHDEKKLLGNHSVPTWVRQAFTSLCAGEWNVLDSLADELARSMELFSPMVDPRREVEAVETVARLEKAHAENAAAAIALIETLEQALAERQASEVEAERQRQRMDTDHQQMKRQISTLTGLLRQQASAGLGARAKRAIATIAMVPALLRGLLDTEPYGKGRQTAAVLHYLFVGHRKGVSPHALMDVDYYLRENPDVAVSGSDPVSHYLRFGWREGRKPHALFDTRYYQDTYPDVRRRGGNPLIHYIRHGWRERRNPNAWFDAAAYEQASGCRGNPLVHYLREGVAAGLSPGPLFDAANYLARNPDVAESGIDPLGHFLDFGRNENREARQSPASSAKPVKLRLLMVSHGHGGGIAEHCSDLVAQLTAEGCDVWLLEGMGGGRCRLLGGPDSRGHLYDSASERGEEQLIEDLRRLCFDHVHYHQVIGFHPTIIALADRLGLAYDVTVHDYAFVCPRVTLLDGNSRFCGGPLSEAECRSCIALWGAHDGIGPLLAKVGEVPKWREWSHRFLVGARRVVVPDADVATRLGRVWPDLQLTVLPHPEPSVSIPVLPPLGGLRVRVAVIGGISKHKGLHILENCARVASQAGLPLDFVVFGAVSDDARLRRYSNVTLLGPYPRQQLPRLLADNRCHMAAFLSVWPETYCYALSEALRAGLFPLVFDLGAQVRRIKALGWGAILPLDSDSAAINAALIHYGMDHPVPHPDQVVGCHYSSILADYLALEPRE